MFDKELTEIVVYICCCFRVVFLYHVSQCCAFIHVLFVTLIILMSLDCVSHWVYLLSVDDLCYINTSPCVDVVWSWVKCSRCCCDIQWCIYYAMLQCKLHGCESEDEVDVLPWLQSCTITCCRYSANSWRVCSRAVAVARSSFRTQQKWLDRGSCWRWERMKLQWMWVVQRAVCWCALWCLCCCCAIEVPVCTFRIMLHLVKIHPLICWCHVLWQ